MRDLYWALKGPGLLSSTHSPFVNRVVADLEIEAQLALQLGSLTQLDVAPGPLETHLLEQTATTQRLGRYFEALLSYWIQKVLKPHVFSSNLIISGIPGEGMRKTTLGELDVVSQREPGMTGEHWEAAVKFYLFAGSTPAEALAPEFYVGTMVRDRLDLKIDKLFNHQLRITDRPETQDTLRKLGINLVRSRALVKGILFYPLGENWQIHPTPVEVSPRHQRGWWLPSDQTQELEVHCRADSRYLILRKVRWLSPGRAPIPAQNPDSGPMTLPELRQFLDRHFGESGHPLMISELNLRLSGEQEISRGLFVDPGWLGRAQTVLHGLRQDSC
ncbi:MAG: DUF1853 family protein [Methylotenera sp.]|nr:DUF1853 family protein [Oligoflexia bacterium]